jgi:hypothetical protein
MYGTSPFMKGSPMWFKKIKTIALLSASLVGVFAFAAVTKANSIQISGVTTTLSAGVWDYAYSMSLTANNGLSATNPNGSSMFVFYDINGLTAPNATFTAGTTAAADWNIVVENKSGAWNSGLSSLVSQGGTNVANDLEFVPNVRFQYVGSGLTATETSAIGTAHLYSTNAPGLFGQYAARWIGLTGNTEVNSQSPVMPATAVPVPAAAWMGMSMLAGLGFVYRARRRANC